MKQSHPIDKIIVVNNGSTDGTQEWLEKQKQYLHIINQENIGGAGGFHTGVKYAHSQNADWMWLMDDDVAPQLDCLEKLLKFDNHDIGVLQPVRKFQDQYVLFESKKLDLSNPFKYLHQSFIENNEINKEPIVIKTIPFEGPLIKKEVVDAIGYPNKDYFIFYDDTDYAHRTTLASKTIKLIPEAILNKKLLPIEDKEALSWRKKYELRNAAYFDRKYGENIQVKFFRPFIRLYREISVAKKKTDFTIVKGLLMLKYTIYGILGNLGKL